MSKSSRGGIVPQTLTPSDAAAKIGINRATFYRWIDRGLVPPASIRVGRTVRWSVRAIDQLIEGGVTDQSGSVA